MKRCMSIAQLLVLAAVAQGALALPVIDVSVGPYIGIYKPSLRILNDQVLVWDHHPEIGSAAAYGVEVKAELPMGLGGGIGLGYWSNASSWREDNSSPGNPNIEDFKIDVSAPMLDVNACYRVPLVPGVLKARAGVAMTMAWGRLQYTYDFLHLSGGTQVTDHFGEIAKGSGTTFGLLAGLDLVTIPKVTIGLEAGYRAGKIDKLTVKESTDPDHVGTVYQYYDHGTNQLLTLPVELSGMHVKLSARYHF